MTTSTGGEAGKSKLLPMILRYINAAACRKELADSLEDWLLFSVRQGATEAEALENIRSAIREYLEAQFRALL
jgi:hypothetical protein